MLRANKEFPRCAATCFTCITAPARSLRRSGFVAFLGSKSGGGEVLGDGVRCARTRTLLPSFCCLELYNVQCLVHVIALQNCTSRYRCVSLPRFLCVFTALYICKIYGAPYCLSCSVKEHVPLPYRPVISSTVKCVIQQFEAVHRFLEGREEKSELWWVQSRRDRIESCTECPTNSRTSSPVCKFHTLTFLSLLAEMSRRLLFSIITVLTYDVCPTRVMRQVPFSGFQIFYNKCVRIKPSLPLFFFYLYSLIITWAYDCPIRFIDLNTCNKIFVSLWYGKQREGKEEERE